MGKSKSLMLISAFLFISSAHAMKENISDNAYIKSISNVTKDLALKFSGEQGKAFIGGVIDTLNSKKTTLDKLPKNIQDSVNALLDKFKLTLEGKPGQLAAIRADKSIAINDKGTPQAYEKPKDADELIKEATVAAKEVSKAVFKETKNNKYIDGVKGIASALTSSAG